MATVADLDVIQNRVAVAVATRERLIKSWTELSSRSRPPVKTQEEIDAEDAELFRFEPLHLGLGAPIPKEYLEGDTQRKEISSNEKLRHLILGNKSGHRGSKSRDSQEKFSNTKRNLKDESSDDDEGRSGLGRAKKVKNSQSAPFIRSILGEDNLRISQSSTAINNRTGPGPSQNSSSNLPANRDTSSKKPLVDYQTDDDGDNEGTGLAPIRPTTPRPKLFSTVQSKSSPGPRSSSPNKISFGDIIDQTNGITRPTAKGSPRTSPSDSEPSDLETVIPATLDADVKKVDSAAASAARTARNRQKRLKKRERQLQQKATASTSSHVGSSPIASVSVPVVAKKLKDRLLDANGN